MPALGSGNLLHREGPASGAARVPDTLPCPSAMSCLVEAGQGVRRRSGRGGVDGHRTDVDGGSCAGPSLCEVSDQERAGRNPGDVWDFNTQPFAGAHFAVMPPALVERCILAGCRPGGVVLDPFAGSGTTGMVALKHGRRFVGIDLSAKYLDLALRTRLAQSASCGRRGGLTVEDRQARTAGTHRPAGARLDGRAAEQGVEFHRCGPGGRGDGRVDSWRGVGTPCADAADVAAVGVGAGV